MLPTFNRAAAQLYFSDHATAADQPPEAAHAASDLLADAAPTPAGWLRTVATRLALAVAVVGALVLMFCASPFLTTRN